MPKGVFVRLAIVGVLGTLAPPASAQSPLPIAVDQLVRLWTDAPQAVTGRVTSITAEAVQVATGADQPVSVVIKLPEMDDLVDRASVALEVAHEPLVMAALIRRRAPGMPAASPRASPRSHHAP